MVARNKKNGEARASPEKLLFTAATLARFLRCGRLLSATSHNKLNLKPNAR